MTLKEAIEWAKAGRRSVKIEIDTQRVDQLNIAAWFYDYDLRTGERVPLTGPVPSLDSMVAARVRDLQTELAALEGTSGTIHAELANLTTMKETAHA